MNDAAARLLTGVRERLVGLARACDGTTAVELMSKHAYEPIVPPEQIVKGFTLGAHDFGVTYRIVMKQILPRVLNSIRLNLKSIMLFLFAGEMIASQDGLAFRIALLRRRVGGQPWSLSLGLDLVRQAAEGLAEAHPRSSAEADEERHQPGEDE